MAARRPAVLARCGAAAGVTGLLAAALVGGGSAASAQQYPIDTPPSPSASPTRGNVGGIGGADPSVTPSAAPGCLRAAEVLFDRDTMLAGGGTGLSVTATPNSIVDVFAYTQPSRQYRVVRSAELGADGVTRFLLTPPANTRVYAQERGCAFGRSQVINVRTTLSLSVVREGVRSYTFMGDSLPARRGGLIVSLYRVRPDGGQVLTAQGRAGEVDGVYRIARTFTGTGRFGFVVRTGQDVMNAPGSSNVRTLDVR